MTLPAPIYPPVVPVSFLEQGDGPTPMTMGMELFTRYHPAATRQRMYERLLASEEWRAEQEEKQRDFLVEQLRFAQEDLSQLRTESERLRAVEGALSGGLRLAAAVPRRVSMSC